ncbi:hypothetical protein BV898_11663 [Hypsibius exemplaris]|uniref:Uncharacterized protein n=1 Tax=Hypsibius exemplaris TaxID=2072580 RepID=A0A1W0WG67_HYPEX|nr:hypothetical protein BV898_11663 [Hypsibius exemplaris]
MEKCSLAGPHTAYLGRRIIPNGILAYLVVLGIWYNIKYHESTWERFGRWAHKFGKPVIYSGDPGWPEPISVSHRMHA